MRKSLYDWCIENDKEHILNEWHQEKNLDSPKEVSYGSAKKKWWRCSNCGFEFEARIHDRTGSGTGCPRCLPRRNTSFPEQALYFYIKKMYPDAISRSKDIFDNRMELDIFIPSKKIGIEYDGLNWHKTEEQHQRELKKYQLCCEKEIMLFRIKDYKADYWNDVASKIFWIRNSKRIRDVQDTIQEVIDYLDPKINIFTKEPFTPDFHSNIIVDLDKDKMDIAKYLTNIENSLAKTRPDIAEQWDYELNKPLTPDMFSRGSNDKVWWKCTVCGSSYRMSISHKNRSDSRCCQKCSNVKSGKSFTRYMVDRVGSLRETNPELAAEWHPSKNGDLTPDNVTAGRFKKAWWVCKKCSYEWEASPNNRSKGVGCPHCSGRVAMPGVDDIKTLRMPYIDEWDYQKNEGIDINTILPNSGKKVFWICKKCGYNWKTEVRCRTKGHNCPSCGHRRSGKSKKKSKN